MDTFPNDRHPEGSAERPSPHPVAHPVAHPVDRPNLRPTGTDQTAERTPVTAPEPVQEPLPFDDEADHPVAFSLTARARREVAPEGLPPLSVVRDERTSKPTTGGVPEAEPGADAWPVRDDPSDTRPSRARALRRAGLSVEAIARQLRVEPLLVRAWIGATSDRAVGRAEHRDDAAPAAEDPEAEQRETAFQLARATAAEQARRGLRRDPGFAAGIGLIAPIVDIDRNALTVTTGDQEVARMSLRWLDEHLPLDPARVRIVLRIGPRAAADLVAHRWANRLGVDRQRVAVARWQDAPDGQSVQALLRVADPGVAATVAGWRDALLAPTGSDPADIAF